MIIKLKNVSVQGKNTEIPSVPFRGNTSDYSGFIYQLMGTLAMQAKVDGIFFSENAPIKLFSIIIKTSLCTNNNTNY